MTARTSNAFLLSGALHALGAGLLLLLTNPFKSEPEPQANIFELVAGEGDNYMATAAPALGSPGGIEFPRTPLPQPKAPAPEPVVKESPPPEPTPVPKKAEPTPAVKEKAPSPMPTATKTKEKAPPAPKEPAITPVSKMKQQVAKAENKARQVVAKERTAAEKAAKEAATKAARDKANAAKLANFERIDTKGIAKGVVGGSTANTTGGAGGKALTVEERDATEAYAALLITRLQEYLRSQPGLDDGLRAEVEVRILADGRLSNPRIVVSSKDTAFDQAVLRALRSISLPARPKGFLEVQTFPVSTHARS